MTRKSGHDTGKESQSSQMTSAKRETHAELSKPDMMAFASRKSRKVATGLMHRLVNWLSKVDRRAVEERVSALRAQFPQAEDQFLIDQLIQRKCEHTARIGAATAATGSIPILGTMISMTVGMIVDLGAVITAQAELVLEIAEVLGVEMSEADRRETVFVVLGLGAGVEHLTSIASQRILRGLGERLSQRWIAHALPLLGIAAAAGINAVSTYVIGKRATAYFTRGPEAMGDWKSNLRALSGLDERKLAGWLSDFGKELGSGMPQMQKSLQQNLQQLQKGQGLKLLQDNRFVQEIKKMPIIDELNKRGQQIGSDALDLGQMMIDKARHLIDPSMGQRPYPQPDAGDSEVSDDSKQQQQGQSGQDEADTLKSERVKPVKAEATDSVKNEPEQVKPASPERSDE